MKIQFIAKVVEQLHSTIFKIIVNGSNLLDFPTTQTKSERIVEFESSVPIIGAYYAIWDSEFIADTKKVIVKSYTQVGLPIMISIEPQVDLSAYSELLYNEHAWPVDLLKNITK